MKNVFEMNIRQIIREELLREAQPQQNYTNRLAKGMTNAIGNAMQEPQAPTYNMQMGNQQIQGNSYGNGVTVAQLQQMFNAGQYQQAYNMLNQVTARSMKERYALQNIGNQLTRMYRSGQMNQQQAQNAPVQTPQQPQTYQQAPMYQQQVQPAQMPQPQQAQPMNSIQPQQQVAMR